MAVAGTRGPRTSVFHCVEQTPALHLGIGGDTHGRRVTLQPASLNDEHSFVSMFMSSLRIAGAPVLFEAGA